MINFCPFFFLLQTERMSTENELTPGVPPRLHTISYPDLTAAIQLNNAVNLLGKAATYGK